MSEEYKQLFDKTDPLSRFVIWDLYDRRDFYTGEPIHFRELEPDHIIPSRLFKDRVMLQEHLLHFGLPLDFPQNSIWNFVPTIRKHNVEKSNTLNDSRILNAIATTKKKATQIRNRIEKSKKDFKLLELISIYASTEKTSEDLESILAILLNEKEFFDSVHYNQDGFYRRSEQNVQIEAFLPSVKKEKGSCLFTFRSIKIRDCNITLNHDQILDTLLRGYKCPSTPEYRNFIVASTAETSIINLGNCRFNLTPYELEELCELVDDFSNSYMRALISADQERGVSEYQTNSHGRIRLIRIKKKLCAEIMHFINKEEKEPYWDVFERYSENIRIISCNHPEMSNGYHAFIEFEESENYGPSYLDNSEVWLCLVPDYQENHQHGGDWWTPQETKEWLVKKLLPYILYRQETSSADKSRLPLKKVPSSFGDFTQGLRIEDYYEERSIPVIHSKDILNQTSLTKAVRQLQEFYYGGHEHFYLAKGLTDVYRVILLLLNKVEAQNFDLSYFASNLGIKNIADKQSVCKELQQMHKAEDECVIYSFKIDLTLRALIYTLGFCRLGFLEIKEIVNVLSDLLSIYNQRIIVRKYERISQQP